MSFQSMVKQSLKRVHPYDGLVLDEVTWSAAHQYHRDQIRLHNLSLHQPGFIAGFDVRAMNPPSRSFVVTAGVGVDTEGNLMILDKAQAYPLPPDRSGKIYLIIEFSEVGSDIIPSSTSGGEQPTRVLEGVKIKDVSQLPSTPHLELCRIELKDASTPIREASYPQFPQSGEIDLRYRKRAGIRRQDRVSVATLYYSGVQADTSWSVHDRGLINLAREVANASNYEMLYVGAKNVQEGLGLNEYDLIYMVTNPEVQCTPEEIRTLKLYLDSGGTLFVEPCLRGRGQTKDFPKSFADFAKQLDRNPKAVTMSHRLFQNRYIFGVAPFGIDAPGLLQEENGLVLGGSDYGCVWQGGREDKPLPRELIRSGLEFGVNLTIYAGERRRPRGVAGM